MRAIFSWISKCLLTAAILAGCAATLPRELLPDSDGIVRTFLVPGGLLDFSDGPEDADRIAEEATARSRIELAERRSTDEARLDQLAYFFRAPEGRAYLLAAEPKALVRAVPQHSCPVQVSVQGQAGTPERDLIADALRLCHADLAAAGQEGCQCALLAHGSVLRAPLEIFEYAIDLPARLFRDGALDPVRYLAREDLREDGVRELSVQANGVQALGITWSEQSADRRVEAIFADGLRAAGTRDPVGFDRGRLVQNFTLEREDGRRLRVIIAP